MMAKISITFMPPLRNCHFSGEVANLRMYSSVNQVMHTASTRASLGLSIWVPNLSVVEMDGMVLRVRAMVEAMMKEIDMMATTCESGLVLLKVSLL